MGAAPKTLRRSETNKVFFGVCGGLADYFDVDPVLVRIAFVLLALANGVGLLVYIIMAIVVPGQFSHASSAGQAARENLERMPEDVADAGQRAGEVLRGEDPQATRSRQNALAVILIGLGVVLLIVNIGGFFLQWLTWGTLWPLILIAIGIAILIGRFRGRA